MERGHTACIRRHLSRSKHSRLAPCPPRSPDFIVPFCCRGSNSRDHKETRATHTLPLRHTSVRIGGTRSGDGEEPGYVLAP